MWSRLRFRRKEMDFNFFLDGFYFQRYEVFGAPRSFHHCFWLNNFLQPVSFDTCRGL